MSGQELKPNFKEKIEILKKQYFPGVERSEVIDAIYELPNLGPMDFNFTGTPIFLKTYIAMILSGFGLGMVALINFFYTKGTLFITPYVMERINAGGILAGFGLVVCIMWIFISMNQGTFNDYTRVINFRWHPLDRRPVKQGEFRVKRVVQIWPRDDNKLLKKAKELEKTMYEDMLLREKQLMALAGMTPELETRLKEKKLVKIDDIATAEIKTLTKISGINDDFASILIAQAKLLMETPTEDEDEDKKFDEDLTEMEKASSLYRMSRMLKKTQGFRDVPKARDIALEGITLRTEFIRIARSIDTEKVYTILECAGDLFILVISDYPLTGGDDDGDATNKQVEFKDHDWVQRTYVYQALNHHATWGEFVHLADYKYYQVPEAKARGVGKEAKVKHAPIAWLQNSDGQVERDVANITGSRLTPTQSDIHNAASSYEASLAEKLLERDKLLTQTISRMKEEAKQIWRDATDWAKNTIAKALEKLLLEEKYREGKGKWNIKLFTNYMIRAFTIICVAFVVYLIFAMVVNGLAGTTFPLPWGGGGGTPIDPGSDVGGLPP